MLPRVNYAQLLFPDFSLILIGFLVCRFTALDRSVWGPIERVVYYLLFPVLLFHSIVRSPLDLGAASSLVFAGWALCLSGIAMAYVLPYLPWIGTRIDRREHAAGAQVAFRFNTYIALALAERLLGAPGTVLIAVLIGVCVPLLNVAAVWPMARHAQRGLLGELIRNPLILATVAGLAANLAGFTMPQWLTPTASRIGAAALAMGLMSAGAGLQLGRMKDAPVLSVGLLSIRHLWLPVVAWLLGHGMGLNDAQRTVLLIFSALPTASSCYVLAVRMGYDGAYAAGLVTLSTLLGMASLPFALGILNGW
jgi:malonate transporter and related proteins